MLILWRKGATAIFYAFCISVQYPEIVSKYRGPVCEWPSFSTLGFKRVVWNIKRQNSSKLSVSHYQEPEIVSKYRGPVFEWPSFSTWDYRDLFEISKGKIVPNYQFKLSVQTIRSNYQFKLSGTQNSFKISRTGVWMALILDIGIQESCLEY